MSLATSTYQAFRSCTASLTSARSLARPAVVRCPTLMSRLRVRCYSEVTSTPESEETKAEEQPDKVSEIEGKLKAKENEVVDLTVCANLSMSNYLSLNPFLGSSALSSSRLFEPTTKCSSREGTNARFCHHPFCVRPFRDR